MRVCICGDRDWSDDQFIEAIMSSFLRPATLDDVVIHGAARGADSIAGKIAKDWGMKVESFPAKWNEFGKAAGVIRNQEMLDSGLDLVIAFHADIEHSKGTKDMVTRARKAGVPTGVFA